MCSAFAFSVFGFACLSVCADEQAQAFRFSKDDLGKMPAGWKADKTGKGQGSNWQVVEDETAPSKTGYVLAQTAEGPGPLFNICVPQDTSGRDVDVAVAFKAVRGEIDQGGGIVWRYRDNNNYYIARMNPLENNYRVYTVVGGKRAQLQTREVRTVKPGEWHRLRVTMRGNHIECYLDSEKLLDVKDDTFQQAGKVGLWTKADAQTYFDDLRVAETGK